MAQRMQQRRGTAAAWTAANSILLAGELGIETDTLNYKLGDGTTAWNSLAYKGLQPTLQGATLQSLISEPSTPSAGFLQLYSKANAGRVMPKFKGPSGLDSYLQSSIFGNGIHAIMPGSATVPMVFGGPAFTAVGTISHPALAGTNLVTQTSRFITTSAAVTNSVVDLRQATTRVWRGNVAGLGGFYVRTRFAIGSAVLNQQMFLGMTSSVAAFTTTQVPSALTSCFGIGFDSADTSLQILTNDAAGTCTKIPLGASFPTNDLEAMFDFTFFCAPNNDRISYTVLNLKTGDSVDGIVTTDLVPSTTFLAYRAYMNNGATAAAVVLGLSRVYVETDY